MRLERRRSTPRKKILLFLAVIFAAVTAFMIKSKDIEFASAAAALTLISALWYLFSSTTMSVLVIDDEGIYDVRLGSQKILWSEVEDVKFEATYNNRYLCVRLRDPDKLIERLSEAKKQKVEFNQQLGFKTFNVDIGNLEVSLLDLKSHIKNNFLGQTRS